MFLSANFRQLWWIISPRIPIVQQARNHLGMVKSGLGLALQWSMRLGEGGRIATILFLYRKSSQTKTIPTAKATIKIKQLRRQPLRPKRLFIFATAFVFVITHPLCWEWENRRSCAEKLFCRVRKAPLGQTTHRSKCPATPRPRP